MEVYLIRHTETVAEKGVCYGQTDIALKKPYLKEFSNIAKQVNVNNVTIYSSPLKRCSILSEFIQKQIKISLPIKFDDRLKEINFGDWELKKWDEINATHWMDDFVNKTTPNGESFQDLYQRVIDFITKELVIKNNNYPTIIIAHAGVIRCFMCYAKHIELKDAFDLEVAYGSVHKIDIH